MLLSRNKSQLGPHRNKYTKNSKWIYCMLYCKRNLLSREGYMWIISQNFENMYVDKNYGMVEDFFVFIK